MEGKVRVLVVDDDEDDFVIVRHMFSEIGGQQYGVDWVASYDEALEAIGRDEHDVYLVDYRLGARDGLELLKEAIATGSRAPMILLTGQGDRDVDVAAMRAGVMDYLVKGSIDPALLERSVRYAVERKHDVEALARQSAAINTSIDGISILRDNGEFLHANDALVKMYGYECAQQLIGKSWHVIYGEDEFARIERDIMPQFWQEGRWRGEVVGTRRDGTTFPQETSMNAMEGGGLVCIGRDISQRKQLQEQLLQAQKMEALGQLAGGVAHDFNNVLSAILGYTQLAKGTLRPGDHTSGYLTEIHKAADRAADLTRQLLAFSRNQIIEPKVVIVDELILGMEKMIRRLVGEDIELVILLSQVRSALRVDPGQMEQLMINLVVNARQAMPGGGKLIIETSVINLADGREEYPPQATAREYVKLAVSDTGAGMTEEVRARAFEPFFTTKEVGKGTGLGLSTCYGIVVQSGGEIEIESEPGKGATVKICLPRVDEPSVRLPMQDDSGHLPLGDETVLLAEDEPLVREVAAHVLRQQGYTVLEASNGHEALSVADEAAVHPIHLLLTDVVMPLMGGPQLVERLKERQLETKVLFTSGYTDDSIVGNHVLTQRAGFMQKPFTPAVLARKVREVLDS